MLRLPELEFVAPSTVADAVKMLAEDPQGTRILAGGTDLVPNLKRRHQHARRLLSLGRLKELRGVSGDPERGLRIGAMTTLRALLRDGALQRAWPGFLTAVRSISSPVLQSMGTLGGNLCLDTRCTYYNQTEEWRSAIGYCMKEVGDTCWVAPSSSRCWAIAASDSAPLLMAIGARVKLVSVRGTRELSLEEFLLDDGIRYLSKEPDELLTEVILPPVANWRATYWKLRRRGSIDFPVLGVGTALRLTDQGNVAEVRIVLGAVGSAPLRARGAEAVLAGRELSEAAVLEAGTAAQEVATALDNTDFTMVWRRQMVPPYVAGTLRELGGLPRVGLIGADGLEC
jgi:4-hydroxybenzoyl-CoA reductase subunit beta